MFIEDVIGACLLLGLPAGLVLAEIEVQGPYDWSYPRLVRGWTPPLGIRCDGSKGVVLWGHLYCRGPRRG